jgi:uncharacterized protein (DUF4213/DUF364 family)
MWELYDDLIEGIPAEFTVDAVICGTQHTLVAAGGGYGLCSTVEFAWRSHMLPQKSLGMSLRDLAVCAKSWNFAEACVGIAGINAYYNRPCLLRELGVTVSGAPHAEDRLNDPFIAYQNIVKGKNVTVVGQFKYLNQLFAPVCNLSVIEKFNPTYGNYPEQAADYLLPESDYVFISSYTLAEKSLPRFLELSRNAYVTVVGHAVTLSPILHKYGVHDLAGFTVIDGAGAEKICGGLGGHIHSIGQKVSFKAQPNPIFRLGTVQQ